MGKNSNITMTITYKFRVSFGDGAPFCDSVVYTRRDMHTKRIYSDDKMIQDILDKVSKFTSNKPLKSNLKS